MLTMAIWAALALSEIQSGAPYEATWESVDARPTPAWFTEARFGVFIHWGVYSVPAWGPKGRYAEWYWNDMQDRNGETWQFHERMYGADFAYQDFAPDFTAELFNPDHWADAIARSGARYIVLTSKHHEGFALWPSMESWNWNSADIGPHRDLCGELTEAVKARGLKMGFYFSFYEWFNPLYRSDLPRYVDQHMLPQLKDLVVRYEPDIVWPDGEWDHPGEAWRSPEFLAWLFNESPVRDRVAVNDRWGGDCRGRHGGFYTTEYGHQSENVRDDHPWEECRGIGGSFGYNRNETLEDYASATDLVRLLVDTVSRGGNLLLNIGPTADGRIPVIMEQRLAEIGAWLDVNGASIYATQAGPWRDLSWGRTTQGDGRVYAHVFDATDAIACPIAPDQIARAYALADPEARALPVTPHGDGAQIDLTSVQRHPAATVIVIQTKP